MLRGIAQNVASALISAFAIASIVAVAVAWFSPRTRPWLAGLAGILLVVAAGWYWRSGAAFPEEDRLQGVTILNQPAVVDGIPVQDEIRRHASGKLHSAFLAEDFEVHGWPAKAGTMIAFDPWGGLMEWTASTDVEVWGRRWPAGTRFNGMMRTGEQLIVSPPGEDPVTLTRPAR